MSERREIAIMLAAFVALALMLVLISSVKGAPGWHDGTGTNAGSLVVWPASNVPPSSATNHFTMPGLYYQQTNCVYTNWFNLMTNWWQVISTNPPEAFTNDLGSPVSNRTTGGVCYRILYTPTNQAYGIEFTNWIGVGWCHTVPTNLCTACVKDALDVTGATCLTNFNASGGVPYATNVSTRVKFASDATDELFRWAWLRWLDETSSWWSTSNSIAPIVYSVPGAPFPLYLIHRLADGTTNFFITDPTLTNLYVTPPSTTNSPFQYPYVTTNLYVGIPDTELLDLYFALSERAQVIPFGSPPADWYFGNDDQSRLENAKERVLAIAPNFAVKELADSNGSFNAYLAVPQTNWVWGDGWSNTLSYLRSLPLWAVSAAEACDRLNLPIGRYLDTTIGTQVVAGWTVGNLTNQFVTNTTATLSNVVVYADYFSRTPYRWFTHALPGQGHVVTQGWTLVNQWNSDTNSGGLLTNQLPLQANTALNIGGLSAKTVLQDVFSVVHSTSNCITTNGVAISTNVCEVNLAVYLYGETRTGGVIALSDSVALLTTNLVSATNSVSVSNAVLTNYNVAAGWHDLDYGPDGVRKMLNDLTWQVRGLEIYPTNITKSGRFSITDDDMGFYKLMNVLDASSWTHYPTNFTVRIPNALWYEGQLCQLSTSNKFVTVEIRKIVKYDSVETFTYTAGCCDRTGCNDPNAPAGCILGPGVSIFETHTITTGNSVWGGTAWADCVPDCSYRNGSMSTSDGYEWPCTEPGGFTCLNTKWVQESTWATSWVSIVSAPFNDPGRFDAYGANDCGNFALRSIRAAERQSSSLAAVESCDNFTNVADVYVKSIRPRGQWGEQTPDIILDFLPWDIYSPAGVLSNWTESTYYVPPTNNLPNCEPPYGRLHCGQTEHLSTLEMEVFVYLGSSTGQTNVTLHNVQSFTESVTFDGSEVGLRYDPTNNAGFWQKISSVPTLQSIHDGSTNIVSLHFVSNTIPSGANNDLFYRYGWAVTNPLVLIKWDADPANGFKYHQ
jgi:hypothetical protein